MEGATGNNRPTAVPEAAARKSIELPTKCVYNFVNNLVKCRACTTKFYWSFGLPQDCASSSRTGGLIRAHRFVPSKMPRIIEVDVKAPGEVQSAEHLGSPVIASKL